MAIAGPRRDRFVAAADCEQDCGRFLAQPVNSWTSLGYLAAGAAVFASTGRSGGRERRGVPGILAAALAANAPGGVAYHGPGVRSGAGCTTLRWWQPSAA